VARLAYLGTPELAVAPLAGLLDAGHEIALVISRPDARRGRGGALTPSPVAAFALERGLPVTDDLSRLASVVIDLAVVVAYGRIIPTALLELVPMVNLHFSLLPRWRGAAPVERAILAGDERTGVCVMAVEPELDTGPIYASCAVEVGDKRLGELRGELVARGTELLCSLLADGELPAPVAQQGDVTYATKLATDELELDFSKRAVELARVVRLERAFTFLGPRRLRVIEARAVPAPAGPPGTLAGLVVATAEGGLELDVVQPEGKRPLEAAAWRRGLQAGDLVRLGRDLDL